MNTFLPGVFTLSLLVALSATAVGQTVEPIVPEWTETLTPVVWDFESDPPGMLPSGWRTATTDESGAEPLCVVVDVVDMPEASRALAIQPDAAPDSTNQAVAMDSIYRNVDMSVRLRPDSGVHEQGGGVIWRWRDPNNYYVCRYNALDGTFSVHKVVRGEKIELDATDAADMQWEGLQMAMSGGGLQWDALVASEVPVEPESPWMTLRVTMMGPEINCYLNDELKLTAWDEEFPGAGLVGLWTKGDAATTFDDLRVIPLD